MNDNVEDSQVRLQRTIDTNDVQTQITRLEGIVVGGGVLTADQSKELARLRERLSQLKSQG